MAGKISVIFMNLVQNIKNLLFYFKYRGVLKRIFLTKKACSRKLFLKSNDWKFSGLALTRHQVQQPQDISCIYPWQMFGDCWPAVYYNISFKVKKRDVVLCKKKTPKHCTSFYLQPTGLGWGQDYTREVALCFIGKLT